jgi:uncharacterized Ntn-hydrolase superfamily protein
MLRPSTFSIVACDLDEPAWGIAVASKFPAVGAVVPWARAGAGAVATQSYANTSFGPEGLLLMESGITAEAALSSLLSKDPEAEHRQVGFVDKQGNPATFTGAACHPWAGGITGDLTGGIRGASYAIQGNILTGAEVVQAMADSFTQDSGPLPWRMYHALLAGDRAGGDRRGRQSAAILVVKPQGGYAGFNDRWIDYRVDDHPDPVVRLGELLEMHELYFGKSTPTDQVSLRGDPLLKLQSIMQRLGYYQGPLHGVYDGATRSALEGFIGNENFEERVDFAEGRCDLPVYEFLLRRFQED